jgi:hypothetical protein
MSNLEGAWPLLFPFLIGEANSNGFGKRLRTVKICSNLNGQLSFFIRLTPNVFIKAYPANLNW